jgi:L-fuculose-phosphate aldolase
VTAQQDIRFTLAAGRRILYRSGCDSMVAGHLTARDASRDGFWMTPFEYFDETTPDSIIRLGWDLTPLDQPGESSPAASFHATIYQRRPDVGAIAHIHSHWVSVLVSTDQTVGMYNVGATLFHEEQAHYVDDGTRPSVDGERMAAALGDRSVLLMRNHGALVVATGVEDVTILALMLEQAARYHIECRAIGGQEIPEAEVRRVKSQYHTYFLPQMWQANLRRLRRSDPDLFGGRA